MNKKRFVTLLISNRDIKNKVICLPYRFRMFAAYDCYCNERISETFLQKDV